MAKGNRVDINYIDNVIKSGNTAQMSTNSNAARKGGISLGYIDSVIAKSKPQLTTPVLPQTAPTLRQYDTSFNSQTLTPAQTKAPTAYGVSTAPDAAPIDKLLNISAGVGARMSGVVEDAAAKPFSRKEQLQARAAADRAAKNAEKISVLETARGANDYIPASAAGAQIDNKYASYDDYLKANKVTSANKAGGTFMDIFMGAQNAYGGGTTLLGEMGESHVQNKANAQKFEKSLPNPLKYAIEHADELIKADTLYETDKLGIVNPQYLYMTDDEAQTYFYYLSKGRKEADKYFNAIYDDLQARRAKAQYTNQAQWAKDHKALAALISLPLSAQGSIGNTLYTAGAAVLGKDISSTDQIFNATRMSNALRSGVKADMNSDGFFSAGNMTDLGFSIGDNLYQMAAFTPQASLYVMSSNAAGAATYDAMERGATPDEAAQYGAFVGLTEYATEKLPLENLVKIADKAASGKAWRELLVDFIGNAATEGGEELVSSYADTLADIEILGDKSEYRRYIKERMAEGMSEKDAKKEAARQFFIVRPAMDAAGGFASGLVFNAGGLALGATGIFADDTTQTVPQQTALAPELYAPMTPVQQAAADLNEGKTLTESQLKDIHAASASEKIQFERDTGISVTDDYSTVKARLTVAAKENAKQSEQRKNVLSDLNALSQSVQQNNAVNDLAALSQEVYGQYPTVALNEAQGTWEDNYGEDFVRNAGRAAQVINERYAPDGNAVTEYSQPLTITSTDGTLRTVTPISRAQIDTEGRYRVSRNIRSQLDAAEKLVSSRGVSLIYYDGRADGVNANGFHVEATAEHPEIIAIDINTEAPVLLVAGHELYHAISEKERTKLTGYMSEYYSERMTEEDAANRLGEALCEPDFCEYLVKQNRTLAQKILDFIRSLFARSPALRLDTAQKQLAKALNGEMKKQSSASGTQFMFAGEKAATANTATLDEAKKQLTSGSSSEEVRQRTGWHQGNDGKWRFEIDDSDMDIHLDGQFTNPDVRRRNELENKFLNTPDQMTAEEFKELRLLAENLKGVKSRPKTVGDYVEHAALFEAYPILRDMPLEFTEDIEANGKYDPAGKKITLAWALRSDEAKLKNTLVHELQHAVQDIEGFAGGASPFFWATRTDEGKRYENLQKKIKDIVSSLSKEDMNKYVRYTDLDYALTDILFSDDYETNAEKQARYEKFEAEQDRLYEELWQNDWFRTLLDYTREAESPVSTYNDLYRRTAGEIEARDTANRRTLSQEERKSTRPDIDRTDAVFAEESADSFSIKRTSNMTYEEQIDSFYGRNNKVQRRDDIYVAGADSALNAFGLESKPFFLLKANLEKITRETASNPHYSSHGIKEKTILNIPKHLQSPALVVIQNGRVSVIADEYVQTKKEKKAPLMIGIKTDSTVDGKPAYEIKSIYGRDNFANWLRLRAADSKIIAGNENKARALLRDVGLQLPEAVAYAGDLTDAILSYSPSSVNPKFMSRSSYYTDIGEGISVKDVDASARAAKSKSFAAQYETINRIAKRAGLKLRYVQGMKQGGQVLNGAAYYQASTGTMYINVNSKDAVNAAFYRGLLSHLKNNDASFVNTLYNYVREYGEKAGWKGDVVKQINSVLKGSADLGESSAFEEVFAGKIGEMFSDENFMRYISRRSMSFLQRLWNNIKSFIVRSLGGTYQIPSDVVDAKTAEEIVGKMSDIQRLFADGLERIGRDRTRAGRQASNAIRKNAAQLDGKYVDLSGRSYAETRWNDYDEENIEYEQMTVSELRERIKKLPDAVLKTFAREQSIELDGATLKDRRAQVQEYLSSMDDNEPISLPAKAYKATDIQPFTSEAQRQNLKNLKALDTPAALTRTYGYQKIGGNLRAYIVNPSSARMSGAHADNLAVIRNLAGALGFDEVGFFTDLVRTDAQGREHRITAPVITSGRKLLINMNESSPYTALVGQAWFNELRRRDMKASNGLLEAYDRYRKLTKNKVDIDRWIGQQLTSTRTVDMFSGSGLFTQQLYDLMNTDASHIVDQLAESKDFARLLTVGSPTTAQKVLHSLRSFGQRNLDRLARILGKSENRAAQALRTAQGRLVLAMSGQSLDDALNKRSERIRNGYDLPKFMSRNVDETGSRTYNDGKEEIKHGRKAERFREDTEHFRQRIREEGFDRVEEREGKTGKIQRAFRSVDKSLFQSQRRAEKELRRLGVKFVCYDGEFGIQFHKGDHTEVSAGNSVTIPGELVAIGIGKENDIAEHIGHECLHYWYGEADTLEYADEVVDTLLNTEATEKLLEHIANKNFNGNVDFADENVSARFKQELAAYITGMIHSGQDISGLVENPDEIISMWDDIVSKRSADGKGIPKDNIKFMSRSVPADEVMRNIEDGDYTDEQLESVYRQIFNAAPDMDADDLRYELPDVIEVLLQDNPSLSFDIGEGRTGALGTDFSQLLEQNANAGDVVERFAETTPRSEEAAEAPREQPIFSEDEEIRDKYNELRSAYGTIPTGANRGSRGDVGVPARTEPKNRVRQAARTYAEAETTPENVVGEIERSIVEGKFSYTPLSDKTANSAARELIEADPGEAAARWEAVVRGDRIATKNEIALAENLILEAAARGDSAEAVRLIAEVAAEGTRAGQAVQAFSMIKKLSPTGQLLAVQKAVDKLNKENEHRGKEKIKLPEEQVQKIADNAQKMQELERRIADLKKQLAEAKDEAGSLRDELEDARSELEDLRRQLDKDIDETKKKVAEQLPRTWQDAFNEWRYLSMLGNPRTHIRNILGNAVFAPTVSLKSKLAAVIESGVSAVQKKRGKEFERTQSLTASKALRDFASKDASEHLEQLASDGKYNAVQEIEEEQSAFSQKHLAGRVLSKISDFNSKALEFEDAMFLKSRNAYALAHYAAANRWNVKFLEANPEALQRAREFAFNEAQRATYRDMNSFSTFMTQAPAARAGQNGLFMRLLRHVAHT